MFLTLLHFYEYNFNSVADVAVALSCSHFYIAVKYFGCCLRQSISKKFYFFIFSQNLFHVIFFFFFWCVCFVAFKCICISAGCRELKLKCNHKHVAFCFCMQNWGFLTQTQTVSSHLKNCRSVYAGNFFHIILYIFFLLITQCEFLAILHCGT